MTLEIETSKFTKDEIIDVLSKYTKVKAMDVRILIELMIKLGIISEYIFKEETK